MKTLTADIPTLKQQLGAVDWFIDKQFAERREVNKRIAKNLEGLDELLSEVLLAFSKGDKEVVIRRVEQ